MGKKRSDLIVELITVFQGDAGREQVRAKKGALKAIIDDFDFAKTYNQSGLSDAEVQDALGKLQLKMYNEVYERGSGSTGSAAAPSAPAVPTEADLLAQDLDLVACDTTLSAKGEQGTSKREHLGFAADEEKHTKDKKALIRQMKIENDKESKTLKTERDRVKELQGISDVERAAENRRVEEASTKRKSEFEKGSKKLAAAQLKLEKKGKEEAVMLAAINFVLKQTADVSHIEDCGFKQGKYMSVVAKEAIPANQNIRFPFQCEAVQKTTSRKVLKMDNRRYDSVPLYLTQIKAALAADPFDPAWSIPTVGCDRLPTEGADGDTASYVSLHPPSS